MTTDFSQIGAKMFINNSATVSAAGSITIQDVNIEDGQDFYSYVGISRTSETGYEARFEGFVYELSIGQQTHANATHRYAESGCSTVIGCEGVCPAANECLWKLSFQSFYDTNDGTTTTPKSVENE